MKEQNFIHFLTQFCKKWHRGKYIHSFIHSQLHSPSNQESYWFVFGLLLCLCPVIMFYLHFGLSGRVHKAAYE